MKNAITGIIAYLVSLPLIRPYHLSLCTIKAYSSIIIRIQSIGNEGFGETTDCPGYFSQDISNVWEFVCKYGSALIGKYPEEALSYIINRRDTSHFVSTSFLTALETLILSIKGLTGSLLNIPLVGIVQGETSKATIADAEKLMRDGFKCMKVKVGFSVAADLERVRCIQNILNPDSQIRIDVNQGYDYSQASEFLEGLDPSGIELFEQPFKTDAWDDMARLSETSPVPLMLDESISGEKALDRTIEMKCAQAVKFKLMKCGSLNYLEELMKKADDAGLKVILGNGVATDIGCLHEAQVLEKLQMTGNAGEMNGFLKGTERFLQPELKVKNGSLIYTSTRPLVQWNQVAKFATKTMMWGNIT